MWVFFIPLIAVLIDSVIVITVGVMLSRRIAHAASLLEGQAGEAISKAASEVQDAMIAHFNKSGWDNPMFQMFRQKSGELATELIGTALDTPQGLPLHIDPSKVTLH